MVSTGNSVFDACDLVELWWQLIDKFSTLVGNQDCWTPISADLVLLHKIDDKLVHKKNAWESLWLVLEFTYHGVNEPGNSFCHFIRKGSCSAHFEKWSVRVMMYLFPLGVSGIGPMRSIPTWCQSFGWTGIGWSPPAAFWSFLFLRWHLSHNPVNRFPVLRQTCFGVVIT